MEAFFNRIDLFVMASFLTGTVAFGITMWRRGVRGRRLLAATWLAFFGFVLTFMMLAHNFETGYRTIVGGMSFTGAPWKVDFRTYSLQLLGFVLLWQGLRCLLAARSHALGGVGALRAAFLSMSIVLAVVVPLIWVHAVFGYMITGLTTVSLVVVAAAARERKPGLVPA